MKSKIFLGIALVSLASVAQAGTISYPASVSLQSTDWFETLSVPKFDPSLGTLDQVDILLQGYVEGDASYENLDALPQEIILHLRAEIQLQRPDLSSLVQVLPVANVNELAGEYDGVQDYAGTSGNFFDNLNNSDSDTDSFTDPSDLALFSGLGNIDLPAQALGTSFGSGAGNLATVFHSRASAAVRVTYHYTEVPEPASLAMLAIGGLTLIRRR